MRGLPIRSPNLPPFSCERHREADRQGRQVQRLLGLRPTLRRPSTAATMAESPAVHVPGFSGEIPERSEGLVRCNPSEADVSQPVVRRPSQCKDANPSKGCRQAPDVVRIARCDDRGVELKSGRYNKGIDGVSRRELQPG